MSEHDQWPALQSVAPVNLQILPRPTTAPKLNTALPAATFQTGKDGLVELPLSAVTDDEGDAITTKVEID